MAKLKEIQGDILQGIVRVLAHHWKNDELFNFIGDLEDLKKEYSASVMNEILVNLKWEIEGGNKDAIQ